MRVATANAIKTLLRMDDTVTPDVRMAIVSLLLPSRQGVERGSVAVDMSISEAACYLGMSRVTLWRMCGRGEVSAVRRGKKFYISGGDVSRLKSCEGESRSA